MDPLEYGEEEDDDLFGDENVLPAVNAAAPITTLHTTLLHPASSGSQPGPSRTPASVPAKLQSSRPKVEPALPSSSEYVRTRITELRMQKGEAEKAPSVGPVSLKSCAMSGESTGADENHTDWRQ